MRNYFNLQNLQTNLADVCQQSSSGCSNSILVNNSSFYMWKVVAQKKICNTKNPVRLPHPQKAKIT